MIYHQCAEHSVLTLKSFFMLMMQKYTMYIVTCDEDQKSLQRVVDKVKEWCDQWLLSLNVTKCCHMSYSSRQSIDTSYTTKRICM